jgi:hypothetical protein
MPESSEALVWLRNNNDRSLREFARIATEVLSG